MLRFGNFIVRLLLKKTRAIIVRSWTTNTNHHTLKHLGALRDDPLWLGWFLDTVKRRRNCRGVNVDEHKNKKNTKQIL